MIIKSKYTSIERDCAEGTVCEKIKHLNSKRFKIYSLQSTYSLFVQFGIMGWFSLLLDWNNYNFFEWPEEPLQGGLNFSLFRIYKYTAFPEMLTKWNSKMNKIHFLLVLQTLLFASAAAGCAAISILPPYNKLAESKNNLRAVFIQTGWADLANRTLWHCVSKHARHRM